MTQSKERPPLTGYRVIDFGQYFAGPAVGKIFAEQGAEVIRINPPTGPRWSSPAERILNRLKEAVTLDLKSPTGRAQAIELVDGADVVIENFRPGVMDRLGLGSEVLTERNPTLVYLSLPGFSATDRERAHIQAWEGVIAASAGMYTDMGLNRVLMGIEAAYSPLPLASAYGASLGALAVTVALFERLSSGIGDVIEVPLATALMEGLAYNAMHIESLPHRYKSLREQEIERRRASGERMDMDYESLQELLDPFYRNFECSDSRLFYNCCQSHHRHLVKSLKLLDLWQETREAGLPLHDPYLRTQDWPPDADCTLFAYPLSRRWADYLSTRMKQAFRAKSSVEWERLYAKWGIPGAAQKTTREWLHSDHPNHSELLIEVDDPAYGLMRQPGPVIWLRDKHGCVIGGRTDNTVFPSSPLAGREGAGTLGVLTPEHKETSRPDAPLADIQVVDLTNVISGPTIASTLARFGAEVIKLDPVKPNFDPWNTVIFGIQANRGKRSMLLDIRADEGRKILYRLLKQADVLICNALDRQLEALGLDRKTLESVNAELIVCRIDAYGGPAWGPRSNDLGYDDTIQASTGIMARFGGTLETPEEHAHFGTIDVMGGFFGALSAALALVHRRRGGEARRAETSIAAAAQFIQTPFLYDFPARPPFNEPSGPAARGEHALYGLYRASDGWFFLGAGRNDLARLTALPELHGLDGLDDLTLRAELEQRFAEGFRIDWVKRLNQAGVGAHTAQSIEFLRQRYLMTPEDAVEQSTRSTYLFVRHYNHPSGRSVTLVPQNAIRFARNRIQTLLANAPRYGAHSMEVLKEIGFSKKRVDELMHRGIVASHWPRCDCYLPD